MDQDSLLQEHTHIESQRQARQFLNRRTRKPLWREYLETAIFAVLAAVILRLFVVSAYRVNSASMEDALLTGDYIFVNKLAYDYGKLPQPGDIVVFKYPNNPDKDFIKRVVALPGQTVQVADKIVYVNGAVAALPYDRQEYRWENHAGRSVVPRQFRTVCRAGGSVFCDG